MTPIKVFSFSLISQIRLTHSSFLKKPPIFPSGMLQSMVNSSSFTLKTLIPFFIPIKISLSTLLPQVRHVISFLLDINSLSLIQFLENALTFVSSFPTYTPKQAKIENQRRISHVENDCIDYVPLIKPVEDPMNKL